MDVLELLQFGAKYDYGYVMKYLSKPSKIKRGDNSIIGRDFQFKKESEINVMRPGDEKIEDRNTVFHYMLSK